MLRDQSWIKNKHWSAMFTHSASPHFLVHTRPLMMMMIPVKTLLPLLRFTNCRVPVLSVAWAQLVCLNDSMRGSQCWVTKAGDTGMGHDDGDTRTLLRSSSLWLAVSSFTGYRVALCWFLAEDIDHIPMVMVTGDKESGMSSSGQGSSWGWSLVTWCLQSPVIAETLCSATEQWAA